MKTHRLLTVLAVIALFVTMVGPVAADLSTHPYTPSGDYSPNAWDPGSAKWIGGLTTGYAEGQTTAMAVEITAPAGDYTIDLCLQVYDGPANDKFAFVGFNSWNTTITGIPKWPNGTTLNYALVSTGLVGGFNLTSITVFDGPKMAAGGCGVGYYGVVVEYTKPAGTSYITFGGVLAYPGAANPDPSSAVTKVPLGKSASTINGTFQSRMVGTGDKTINYKGSDVIAQADIAASKDCVAYTGSSGRYVIRTVNNGPAVAYGMGLVDALPAGVVPTSASSILVTGGVATNYSNCSYSLSSPYTVTCNALTQPLLWKVADPTAQWIVLIEFTGAPVPNTNVATVSSQTPDSITANNNTGFVGSALCTSSNAVDLISFTAVGGESSVAVAWETASETNSVGFNLFRRDSVSDGRTQLNPEIITAQAMGQAVGSSYAFTDSAVSKGVTYTYWLEELDTAGISTLYGPVFTRLVEAAAPAPVLSRPVRVAPIIALPGLPEPVIVLPVLQAPVLVAPALPAPIVQPAPVMPGPIAPPPIMGLPVESGLE